MNWMMWIAESSLLTLAWLAGFALIFAMLSRWMPCNRGMVWWRDLRAASTDLLYWFVVPVFVRVGTALLLAAGTALLPDLTHLFGIAPNELPLWLQCVAILLIQDFLLYWIHRLFHTRRAWPFHAVHHSPHVLDWTAAARFHVVNKLLSFGLVDAVVLLLGFSPMALVALVPLESIYSSMVHANLNWTFGPLRHVFASPVFHRWHHTTEREGIDKNFASTFPLLDVVFGTFYMPPGRVPEQFGDPDFPQEFWAQTVAPFTGTRPRPSWARRIDVALAGAFAAILVLGLVHRHTLQTRDAHFAHGSSLYDAEDYSAAIRAYTEVLALDAECAPAYVNRGSALFNLGEADRALVDFDRAVSLDPSYALAWWRRGFVHQALGHQAQADADHARARTLDPTLGPR